MKDKRQRMAMAWPAYAMYADPTLAATLLAAATGLPPIPYSAPANHFNPAAYPVAAAAAYYARYAPYNTANTSPHRPHPRNAPVYPTHPSVMPQPPLPSIHLQSLTVPPMPSAAFPIGSSPNVNATYRPVLRDISPVHSDASSDCDCTGNQQPQHSHRINVAVAQQRQQHQQQQQQQQQQSIDKCGGEERQQVKLPYGVPIVSVAPTTSMPIIQHRIEQNRIEQNRIEAPKLFQPYKNDVSEEYLA